MSSLFEFINSTNERHKDDWSLTTRKIYFARLLLANLVVGSSQLKTIERQFTGKFKVIPFPYKTEYFELSSRTRAHQSLIAYINREDACLDILVDLVRTKRIDLSVANSLALAQSVKDRYELELNCILRSFNQHDVHYVNVPTWNEIRIPTYKTMLCCGNSTASCVLCKILKTVMKTCG